MASKNLVNSFSETFNSLLENYGFELCHKSLGKEKYIEYEKSQGDAIFTFSVLFLRLGYVNLFLSIKYPQLTEKFGDVEDIFQVDLRRYLFPKNRGDYFNSGRQIDSPYQDDLKKEQNLQAVCSGIFYEIFLKTVPQILIKLDTLEKAHALVIIIQFYSRGVKNYKC